MGAPPKDAKLERLAAACNANDLDLVAAFVDLLRGRNRSELTKLAKFCERVSENANGSATEWSRVKQLIRDQPRQGVLIPDMGSEITGVFNALRATARLSVR